MKKFVIATAIAATALAPAAMVSAAGNGQGAGGVTGPAFYVDGDLYRTVGTPTDISETGAPAHSFDTIYAIDGQPNVATAAPGDTDYNGGRWMVLPVTFDDGDYELALAAADANDSGDLDSDAELDAALALGYGTVGEVAANFICPVIPQPGR